MKRVIYYVAVSWIVTLAVQFLGGSTMQGFLAGLFVPPILLLTYILWKSRSINKRTRHEHWTARREPR